MIVKLDRVMLKLKMVVGLIFSVLSLWIISPELIRGSLRDNPVNQFLSLIVLFGVLLSIVLIIDGIVNLKGHGKFLELDDNSLTYYGQAFGRKTFEIPLSEIAFVKKSWSTRMEDIEHSSTVRYSLKRIEHVFDYDAEVGDKERYRVLLVFFKNGETAVTYDKKLGHQSRKKRAYIAKMRMIQIPLTSGEIFSDQEMNDFINERKNHDR
ncbi:hypothetical protein [uncultured Streptococcus sp.]|uniref:hypothetical protein n=1 Tax=uncultured Streptococcus sp. TaxID=83427 RepID=UPI0028DCDD9C|nr:hypothetical protein [uncultured Streptococcus sp.]